VTLKIIDCDWLELVQMDEQHRIGRDLPSRAAGSGFQFGGEDATVEQTGQVVMSRPLLRLFLRQARPLVSRLGRQRIGAEMRTRNFGQSIKLFPFETLTACFFQPYHRLVNG
jgi:hypothetical protein